MNKIFQLFIVIMLIINIQYGYSQYVSDTRQLNESPADYQRIVRYDFKDRDVIGLPGNGSYSGTMTFAPWSDATGGENYQLNFNSDGIFFRQGLSGNAWGNWRNIVIANSSGVIVAEAGAGTLQLKSGDKNHAYMEFYVHSNSPSSRSAWFGYGKANDINLTARNEIPNGNINLITSNGNIGIDTYTPREKLSVNGKIRAHEIKVETSNWPDYVFEEGYPVGKLAELENYIKTHKKLPDMPSAKEVETNGIALGEMVKLQQQKIEELTLHLIEKDKQIIRLKQADEMKTLALSQILERLKKLEKN
ncbi:hypothetical protein [Pedobacter sp. AJM]|uniref:hypothetical protein n=1 Tax=Pedobacter sp. AJM TaxID=2003629 RepID=UPI0011250C51|nr:hypothetical protein [Pedobacter sp. AJM]